MNEPEKRAELIDLVLSAACWGDAEGSRIRIKFPIRKRHLISHGRHSKPENADYVLQYKNRNLAVIESKGRDKYYTKGIGQVKDYTGKLKVRFTYSTNGIKIYRVDMNESQQGEVTSYPAIYEFWVMTFGEQNKLQPLSAVCRDKLLSVPFKDRGGTWQPQYYQENTITKVLEAISENKDRILLTFATGTGKTANAFQIAWKLFQAKWNINKDGQRSPKFLFLADRNFLADKTKLHLGNFGPKQDEILNFVLSQYVDRGFDELDETKISDLLIRNYKTIGEA